MKLSSPEYVLLIILGALATYRLTVLLIEDEILRPVRERIWKKHPPAASFLGYLITCPWCISIWAAAFLVVGYILIPYITIAFACILTLSLLAALIDEVRHR